MAEVAVENKETSVVEKEVEETDTKKDVENSDKSSENETADDAKETGDADKAEDARDDDETSDDKKKSKQMVIPQIHVLLDSVVEKNSVLRAKIVEKYYKRLKIAK